MRVAILILCFAANALGYIALGGREKIDLEKIDNFDDIRLRLVQYFNEKFDHKQSFAFYHASKMEKQVVNGLLYHIEFSMVATKCPKEKSSYTKMIGMGYHKCKIDGDVQPEECSATVWEQRHNDLLNVTNMKCLPKVTLLLHRSARSVSTREEHAQIGSPQDFAVFKARYARSYSTPEEEMKRFGIFRANMLKAHVLNAVELGSATYGHSPFADMTEEEFLQTRRSSQWDLNRMPERQAAPVPATPPTAFDWRDHNAVTPVKNQGSCGSCWAFSTTGNVEGQWAIKKKKLVALSEQELVDCDHVDKGCNGGLPTDAYKAIEKLGGLETETAYPYQGENESCKFKKSLVKVFINSSVSLPTDENKMAAWLAANGPISIGINANAMQFYFGGISHPWKIFCNPNKLDHGVLIVGYGVKNSEPYWIVKNSWGPSWGEKGYYMVYRGAGVCGLNKMPTSAIVN